MAVAVQEIKDGVAVWIEIGVSIAGRKIYEQTPGLAKDLRVQRVCLAGIDLGLGSPGQWEREHHEVEKLFHYCKVFAVRLSDVRRLLY